MANGIRNGVLFRGQDELEILGTVKTIAFDKTGTLTQGKPAVAGVVNCTTGWTDDEILLARRFRRAPLRAPARRRDRQCGAGPASSRFLSHRNLPPAPARGSSPPSMAVPWRSATPISSPSWASISGGRSRSPPICATRANRPSWSATGRMCAASSASPIRSVPKLRRSWPIWAISRSAAPPCSPATTRWSPRSSRTTPACARSMPICCRKKNWEWSGRWSRAPRLG